MIKMDYIHSQKIEREKVENNMTFLGLMIVQNKLKSTTKASIETLHSAKLRMVMATGDNILTAISVAKECLLVRPDSQAITCEITKEKGESKLNWSHVEAFIDDEEDERNFDFQKYTNVTDTNHNEFSYKGKNFSVESLNLSNKDINLSERHQLEKDQMKEPELLIEDNDLEEAMQIDTDNNPFINQINDDKFIAISGSTFESLWKMKNKYSELKIEKFKTFYELFKLILKHTVVFARMSPEHKTILIESLRNEEFIVCMCGDGANDCGALRAADVGVSLSLEEASIAAHFTSNIPDISCLIKLLREGKASLVTSIECFKYMMLYSIIQFISVTLLIICNSYLADNQFLAADVFIIFPLAIFIARYIKFLFRTGAYHKLTHHQPTGALISFPIISSILIQSAIQFGAQVN